MAKKKQAVEMISVAILDEQGFYQGVQHIAESELTDAHVQVPPDCDLPIGKYYWDKQRKTFMPDRELAIAAMKERLQRKVKKG